jgi:predicted ester cyclase
VQLTGTHKGELIGVPPTGKRVDIQLIDIMRFDGAGLICEHWGVADMLSLMQQLGVVPASAPA